MALELTANIGATDTRFEVTGEVPPSIVAGEYRFRLDDEVLDLVGFSPAQGIRTWPVDRNAWIVQRGILDTTPATHEMGAPIEAVVDAYTAGADEDQPGPIPDGGGPHAASHTDGGEDEVTVAQSQVTGLAAALAARPAIQEIDLDDTAATTAQFSEPFDTRGRGVLTLYVQATYGEALAMRVLTRLAGEPWSILPFVELHHDSGTPFLDYGGEWPAVSSTIKGTWMLAAIGLLDETVVVAQPANTPSGSIATADTDFTDPEANVRFSAGGPPDALAGDWGNAFSVQFVDPGEPDQPLTVSSEDGYLLTISLSTDGGGVLQSFASDLLKAMRQTELNVLSAFNPWVISVDLLGMDGPLEATSVIPLAGGTSGAAGVTYRVRGSV